MSKSEYMMCTWVDRRSDSRVCRRDMDAATRERMHHSSDDGEVPRLGRGLDGKRRQQTRERDHSVVHQ